MNFYEAEKILRLTPIKKESVSIAKDICTGKMHIFPTLSPIDLDVKLNNIYAALCETRYPSAESTYAVYVYALYPVSYLLNAYEVTQKIVFLEQALQFSLDFISWENDAEKKINKKRYSILYGDHSVSNRTQALGYLIVCLNHEKIEIPKTIFDYMLKLGVYLSDSNNYSNYNHGLMMDLSLLGLVHVLDGNNYVYPLFFTKVLKERLRQSLTRDLTNDGVHIENSPGYHFWIVTFLTKITSSLKSFDRDLYDTAAKLLELSKDYAKYVTRQDGTVPAIGDTHSNLRYAPSSGLSSKFFPDSNIIIFRNDDFKTWAYFSSGYKTNVHKHEDNGALNVFYKGRDLLIDPGFLNYEGTEESLELRAVKSHNTSAINSAGQNLKTVDLKKTNNYSTNLSNSCIVNYGKIKNHEYGLAIIDESDNLVIARLVLFLENSDIVVFDYVLNSLNFHSLEQYFIVSETLKVKNAKYLAYKAVGGSDFSVNIINMNNDASNLCFLEKAKYAEKFNLLGITNRIVFQTNKKYLCTYIGDNPDEVKWDEEFLYVRKQAISPKLLILQELNKKKYYNEDYCAHLKYDTGERLWLSNDSIIVEAVLKENFQYAFYLQKNDDIERVFYTENFTHDFLLTDSGEYIITFFYKDKLGARTFNRKYFYYDEISGIKIISKLTRC